MGSLKYHHVLCCLDMTMGDEKILHFVKILSEAGLLDRLKVLHVIDNDFQEKVLKYAGHDSWINYKNEISQHLQEKVDAILGKGLEVEILVKGGSPLEVINTKSKSESTDLVIVGKKMKGNGTGIASNHIARSSYCDVIFIPEHWDLTVDSALVAYDFSEHAEFTLELAAEVSERLNLNDVQVLNVLASPSGYFKTGRLHLDFLEAEKIATNKNWKKEVELHSEYSNFQFETLENEKNNVAHYVELKSSQMNAPLVFMGSKGKTAGSAFLLGSVTEKFLHYGFTYPFWIHKMRGENFDLFDAVFKGD